jgi:hypothetical protein
MYESCYEITELASIEPSLSMQWTVGRYVWCVSECGEDNYTRTLASDDA